MGDDQNIVLAEGETKETPETAEKEVMKRLRELVEQQKQNKKPNPSLENEIKRQLTEFLSSGEVTAGEWDYIEKIYLPTVTDAAMAVLKTKDSIAQFGFVELLLTRKTEKARTLQIAIAGNVVAQDTTVAASLLSTALSPYAKNPKNWVKLSKEAKNNIAKSFINRSEKWIPFNAPDEQIKDFLISFVEVFTDRTFYQRSKSQKYLRDFSLWAIDSLNLIEIDEAIRKEAFHRINEMARSLPKEFAETIKLKIAASLPQIEPQVTQDEKVAVQTESKLERPSDNKASPVEAEIQEGETIENIKREAQDEVPSDKQESGTELPSLNAPIIEETQIEQSQELKDLEPRASEPAVPPIKETKKLSVAVPSTQKPADEENHLLLSRAEELIRLKKTEIEQRRLEVDVLSNFISTVNILQERVSALTDELNQTRNQTANLQTANESLHNQLNQSLQAHRSTTEALRTGEEKLHQIEKELNDEKSARELDKKRYGERLEREGQEGLNQFKGKISRRLNHVFAKKRSRENQQPDAKLAESLFHFFKEVEDILKEMGISI